MKSLLALITALVLTACSSPQKLLGSGEAATPYGYAKLCLEQPNLAACPKAKKLTLTQVNVDINSLPYVSEADDDWTPITASGGDCDSYATAKFQVLADMGWPVESLRLATGWTANGVYHAVLLVDLEGQTWVLDNRYPLPMEYQLLNYLWDRLQVAGTQRWQHWLCIQ